MYQELDKSPKAWTFKRQDPKISDDDLLQIRWCNEAKSNQIWQDYISSEHNHPDLLTQQDWSEQSSAKLARIDWEARWEADEWRLPDELSLHLQSWSDDTIVYFCYHADDIYETTWAVFQRCWKNFLFFNHGPFLLGRKKKQAVQFSSHGDSVLLVRPSQ